MMRLNIVYFTLDKGSRSRSVFDYPYLRFYFQGKLSAYGSQSAMSPTIVIVAHYDSQNVVPVSEIIPFL